MDIIYLDGRRILQSSKNKIKGYNKIMIGLLIICCMLTFLVGGGYYFFKNPIILPKIETNFLIKEIHPAEREGGSGGDAKGDYTQLSKNIDVGIQWQNDENAFGKFEEIIARRFVGGEQKKETIYKKSDYPNLFKKNKTGLQIVFYGKDNTYDITGENEVHLYYKNELGIEVQLTSSDMKKNEIKKEDLDRSLKLADSELYTYDTTGGNTKTEADFTGKGYRMYMCEVGDMFNVVSQKLGSGVTIDTDAQNLENKQFHIVPNKDSNSKFSLKIQDSLFGTVDDNGTIGLVDKLSSNVIIFEMLEGSYDKSKRFKPSGTENEGKFLVYSETDGKLMFKNINDMNEQEYKTMDIIVTEEDTYTTNMCMDTLASSQNSDASSNPPAASSNPPATSSNPPATATSSNPPAAAALTGSLFGRPAEGIYFIQNVASGYWGRFDGTQIVFNRSSKQYTDKFKWEVKHVPNTTNQITLKTKQLNKYCKFSSNYNTTPCLSGENSASKYRMRIVNERSNTYFIETKIGDNWKKCKPDMNGEDETFSCKGQAGATGETSQMFKFIDARPYVNDKYHDNLDACMNDAADNWSKKQDCCGSLQFPNKQKSNNSWCMSNT